MTDNQDATPSSMSISAELAKRIQDELGENVYLCYQCVKCTSGCPVGEFFDWQPNQVMRALQLGQGDDVPGSAVTTMLKSKTVKLSPVWT